MKALQLEPPLGLRYESLLATYLDAGFRTRQVANSYQTIAGALEQLLSASILCAGAWIVMTSSDFTIGMLVAFQMFAARVAQPLLRLTGLWQQFQQAAIAVKRLADVMDVPAEPHCVAPTRVAQGAGPHRVRGCGLPVCAGASLAAPATSRSRSSPANASCSPVGPAAARARC